MPMVIGGGMMRGVKGREENEDGGGMGFCEASGFRFGLAFFYIGVCVAILSWLGLALDPGCLLTPVS